MKGFHFWSIVLIGMMTPFAHAQEFDATLQLRPRYEYRHGYKDFLPENQKPASLISQRTRLNLNLKNDDWNVYLSMHNNGVWGENNLAAINNKSSFSIFEAWAKYQFSPKMSLKIGRQTLIYDNQRVLGALDWAQQGLNHDAIVLQYQDQNWELHGGYALNNATESLDKKPYLINNYKNMQYVWMHTKVATIDMSFLMINAGYEAENTTTEIVTEYHQTWGTFWNYKSKNWLVASAFYAQTGKLDLQKKEAYNAFVKNQYQWNNRLSSAIGYEYLSGTKQGASAKVNRSFAPLYGTNHIFNGAMDFFNNGNFQNSVGLHDIFLTGKWQLSKWNLELTPHIFYAAKDILNSNNEKTASLLGTEIDLTAVYQVQKDLKITTGYSQLFATSNFETLRNSTPKTNNHWAWLMVTFEPTLFSLKKWLY